jgi:hypothetical protein
MTTSPRAIKFQSCMCVGQKCLLHMGGIVTFARLWGSAGSPIASRHGSVGAGFKLRSTSSNRSLASVSRAPSHASTSFTGSSADFMSAHSKEIDLYTWGRYTHPRTSQKGTRVSYSLQIRRWSALQQGASEAQIHHSRQVS